MAETIKIGGELESTATGNVVAAASAIKDKVKNKYQGEINAETDATLANHASAIQGLNSQNYVTVTATDQTTAVTDVLPATGAVNTVYRVGNWDGSQFDEAVYSEYAWDGSEYIHLSTKTQIGEVFDISAYHATGGTLATYADLSAALDSNNGGGVPQSLQKGGMSVKFVQSSDNKYVQFRYMSSSTATADFTNVANWQGVFDTVEDDNNLVTGKGIKANTIEEKEHPIADNDVVGYLTDKNKSVIAKLMKNGAVEWLVKNSKDIANNIRFENIEELLSYVSSEVPDSGNGIIKYLTDKNGVVIATINNVGDTEFKGGGGFAGEITTSKSISFDAIKVTTDRKGSIIGWITSTGKVHLEELDVKNLEVENGTDIGIPEQLFPLLGIIANGTENHKFVNDKTLNLFFAQKGEYRKDGTNIETYPVISINDDDAYDYQMPTSNIWSATDETSPSSYALKKGGYASLLYPLLKALNTKHATTINGKLTCGVCAEGQRIGLTPLYGMEDSFDGNLNANGRILKALVEREDWECAIHSMTARYFSRSYLVNGLDSEFANSLLVNAVYDGHNGLGWGSTTCYDTVTKKNYKVKPIPSGQTDSPGWDECPLHYAKPYLAVSKESNSRIVINPTYSVKYQVDTWMKRASEAGLPYIKVVHPWGKSHSSWHVKEDMKYADTVIMGLSKKTVNILPYRVCPHRCSWGVDNSDIDYNVYNKTSYQSLIDIIDTCIEEKGWLIFRGHTYESQYLNYYKSAYSELYGADAADCGPLCYKDDNYPEEWIVPLKYAELMDMIGDNINDYWNNPPARLNIQSWADWYPCPGTTLAMLYDALEYAIGQGVKFSREEDVLKEFGNMFAIGCETISAFATDKRLAPEDRFTSFCRIGSDGSITYYNK